MKRLVFCLLCCWYTQDVHAQPDTLYMQFFKFWEAYDWKNAIATGESWKSTAKVGNTPRDSFNYGYFSSKLGRAYLLVGDFDNSNLNYGEAFHYVSPDSMHYAVICTELAQLYMMQARLTEGEAQAGKAVDWYRQHASTHSDKFPNAIRVLGDLLYMQGQFVLAERQFQTALQLWLSNGFPPSKVLATIYDDLGLCYDQQNRPLQAEYYFLKADTLSRQLLKPNDPMRYAVKTQLTQMYLNKGEWDTARRLIQELGEQAAEQFGEHSDRYAQYLHVKAQMFEVIGEGDNARATLESQCGIYQNLYGGRHNQTINAQINLGLTLTNLQENDMAKDIALRALDSIDASGEDYLNLKIRVYGLLADCTDNDIEWRRKALAVESETGSPTAETVAMLAVDYLWHSMPDSAAQVLTILDTLERYIPEGDAVMRRIHSARGQLAAERNDYATALAQWSIMIVNAKRKFIDNLFTGNEVQRMEQYKKIIWFNNLFLTYARTEAAKKAGIAGMALDFDIFTKSLLLGVAQKIKASALDGHDPVLKNAFENWVKAREQLAWCYTQTAAELQRQQINLLQLEHTADSLESVVAMHDAMFAAENFRQPYTWQKVTANLAPGEAAIQIRRFVNERKEEGDPARYAFYILRPEMHDYPEMVFVEDGDRLEDVLTEAYLSACAKPGGKGDTGDWYQAVWKKLEPYLKGVSRIYLSADGIFHKINLEAIRLPGGEYVADHYQILPVFSLKDIRTEAERKAPEYAGKTALLVGNPAFYQPPGDNGAVLTLRSVTDMPDTLAASDGGTRALAEMRGLRLVPLPESGKEVTAIAHLMRRQNWAVTILTDNNATAARVKTFENATVVHLATHGYFLANDRSGTAGLSRKVLSDNPMLRSMLFFAGAQNTLDLAPLPNDDGILTAYEAQYMHLEHTQLVVLSACQTAQGKIQNGEGVFGLQRALRIAGAQHVLLSLWDIDDKVGKEFMQVFYQNWLAGTSKTAAFRTAQAAIRKKYPQPFYWAGFVLIGG